MKRRDGLPKCSIKPKGEKSICRAFCSHALHYPEQERKGEKKEA